MNIIFKLIDMKSDRDDIVFFVDIIKITQNNLTIMNVNSLIDIDIFCQNIMLHKLMKIYSFFIFEFQSK